MEDKVKHELPTEPFVIEGLRPSTQYSVEVLARKVTVNELGPATKEDLPAYADKLEGEGRFRVIEGSESGHCCFEATVVDTASPEHNSDGTFSGYETVCETFSMEDAQRVMNALNESDFEVS